MKKKILMLAAIFFCCTIMISINVKAQCGEATATSAIQVTSDINGGYFYNNRYHITRDIVINGSATFYKADLIIEPNVTITIAKTANVTFRFAHLHTCNGMWKGINVLEGGRLTLTQDADFTTIVEDAEVAINLDFPSNGFLANDYLLTCNGAVFNRNKTGIKISNFFYNLSGNSLLPFNITGSVFTSRDIPFDYNVPFGFNGNRLDISFCYPSSNVYPTPTLAAPFFANPTFPCPDNTVGAFLRTTTPNQKPSFGIVLENLGEGSGLINIGGLPLAGGSSSTSNINYNLFDNVNIGIDAQSASFQVNNCFFQKKNQYCPLGIGIYAHGDGNIGTTNAVINNTDPQGNTTYNKNTFYDLATAISVVNYKKIVINETDIRSNKGVANYGSAGQTGIYIEDDGSAAKVDVSNNRVYNIDNAISYLNTAVPSTTGATQQDISFNYNTIAAQLPGVAPTNKEVVLTAIRLNGNNEPNISLSPDRLPIKCNGNMITGVYNGIIASGFQTKTIFCTDNEIQLAQQPSTPARPNREQFGISLSFGNPAIDATKKAIRSIVINNYVNGNACGTCNQTGIYLTQQDFTNVECNKAENLLHGYRFLGISNATQFWDNTIEPTNVYGFTLDQGGQIGTQGTSSQKTGYCNSDNNWKMPKATWLGYTPKHYMTFVRNAIARNSPLYVSNTTTLNPQGGGWSTSFSGFPVYSTGSTSIRTQLPSITGCTHCGHTAITNIAQQSVDIETIATLEDIADGSIELIEDDPAQRLYVLQQELYSNLQAAGNQYANNTTLDNFVQNNALGSFDYIYYTQQYLQDSNMVAVDDLLAGFPSNNIVDDNYHTYYTWIANMIDSPSYTPNIDEVFNLASLCPAKNGNVVFKARTLYNKLTHSGTIFTDECPETTAAARGIKPIATIDNLANKNLLIYPNPAINFIKIQNANFSSVSITDITGRVLQRQQCVGLDVETIDISHLKQGIYLVQLYGNDGNINTQKLIKQ